MSRAPVVEPASRQAVGRYTDVGRAIEPGELPRQGERRKQHVKHGAVDDPNPALKGKRQRVAVNVKTDALESEYAYGRISEAAYRAGRAYQHVLELAGGRPTGGGQWMEGARVDAPRAHEAAIVRGLKTAKRALEVEREALPIIGVLGANVLRMVLGDRLTIAEVAVACDGAATRWTIGFYAETFRRSLEAIADEWGKSGYGP